ncbi:tRNA (N(6)-L-threonylcarbamoyladenosine(37)-C(2))-methylthiotransferase [Candidatus Bathyarchaeota archaeon]|nr:tRNA (N(6)-L-threonylcarbamoyladenosine(37)-C(2))-methylthiotransferase [Candidatus Bathyarchaeota archaeon]
MTSINVTSYGCSANTADAEIIKGILKRKGFSIIDSPLKSDLNIILTCVVKTPTEHKMNKRIKRLYKLEHPLIIAGCMPKAMKKQVEDIAPKASVVGPDDILKIVEAVNLTLNGIRVDFTEGTPAERTCLPRIRENKLVHIQPICTGCLGDCNYCIVKYARGRLFSFQPEEIIRDIEQAIVDGCREVWVTAEDTAAYNFNGVKLPQLLRRITDIPSNFRIRVGMMTPNQLLEIKEELIEAYKNKKIFNFVHIPIQSGNNRILRKMNRKYTVENFKGIVSDLRETFPLIGISTDIICGFPSETMEEFNDSIELIKWLKPDVLNISRFWARPGTKATEMKGRLHGRETKERSRMLTRLWDQMSVEVGKKWIGWEGEILLDEKGWEKTLVGRNYAYKAIGVESNARLGQFINVRATDSGAGYLKAEIV